MVSGYLPEIAWGYSLPRTSDFCLGASQLFETDFYGADYMKGISSWPHTKEENIQLVDNVCDFHGALGFQLLKPFLATSQNREIRINFQLSFHSVVNCGEGTWDIQSIVETGKSKGIVLQQTISLSGERNMPVRLSLRVPNWSDGISAVDEAGKAIDFEPKQGYWHSKESIIPVLLFNITRSLPGSINAYIIHRVELSV